MSWTLLAVLAVLVPTLAGWAKSPSAVRGPEYSRLFERAEADYNQGRWREALRGLSLIYGTEVPVQAFYDTLDRRKAEYLAKLTPETRLVVGEGGLRFALEELKDHFVQILLIRPESFYHRLGIGSELPWARLLHLYAVLGREPQKPSDPLLAPARPAVDLSEALAQGDPWLVSAALFLARKDPGRIEPGEVIRRWEDRPDLWDDTCAEQALLFLAAQRPEKLRNLKISDGFAAGQISRLKPIGKSEPAGAEVLYFPGDDLGLEEKDFLRPAPCRVLGVKRLHGGSPDSTPPGDFRPAIGFCKQGFLELPPGRYGLSYSEGRVRGRSEPFKVKAGSVTRVVVAVRGEV